MIILKAMWQRGHEVKGLKLLQQLSLLLSTSSCLQLIVSKHLQLLELKCVSRRDVKYRSTAKYSKYPTWDHFNPQSSAGIPRISPHLRRERSKDVTHLIYRTLLWRRSDGPFRHSGRPLFFSCLGINQRFLPCVKSGTAGKLFPAGTEIKEDARNWAGGGEDPVSLESRASSAAICR